jgi:hypothetical protein
LGHPFKAKTVIGDTPARDRWLDDKELKAVWDAGKAGGPAMSIGICLNICRDSATSATEARLATLDCRFDEAHQSGQQPYRTQRAGTGLVPALHQMRRRVLKPGGQLAFVEHGLSPEGRIARWQHRLTPCWKRIAGGCHLDRKTDDLIRTAGFELNDIATGYITEPKPWTFMYEGRASQRAPNQAS